MSKLTKYLNFIPKRIRNKWFLAFGILFIWILFFEDTNLISVIRTKIKIADKKEQWEHKQNLIEEGKRKKAMILNNVEKYARETYWMKKENEEIFIFPKKEKDN